MPESQESMMIQPDIPQSSAADQPETSGRFESSRVVDSISLRTFAFWLLPLVVAFLISSCSTDPGDSSQSLAAAHPDSLNKDGAISDGELQPLMSTFGAIRLLVQPLASGRNVDVLLAPGISPHAYSPKPSDVRHVREAMLLIYAHPDVDGWTSSMTDGARLALFQQEGDGMEEVEQTSVPADGHHHSDDPHYWTDPVAANQAIRLLSDTICDLDSNRCAATRRQATAFSARIDSVQTMLQERIASSEVECVITAEPFMDRFLERFGVEYFGPISRSPELEPSPAGLAALIRAANEHGCSRLVVPSFQENRFAKRLAKEHDWEIIAVDALATEASSYEEYLGQLASAILARTND